MDSATSASAAMSAATSANPVDLLGLRIAHIGINAVSPEEAEAITDLFSALMGLEKNVVMPPSYFAGTLVEVMKNGGRGAKGHIGFHVDDLDQAIAYFEARGFAVNEATRTVFPDGKRQLIYFKDEIAGFAIHLTTQE